VIGAALVSITSVRRVSGSFEKYPAAAATSALVASLANACIRSFGACGPCHALRRAPLRMSATWNDVGGGEARKRRILGSPLAVRQVTVAAGRHGGFASMRNDVWHRRM
jgi:hypothetical protein